MGKLRTHITWFDEDDGFIHSVKLKEENYTPSEYEEMDLNEVERRMIHEKRIADEQLEENNLRHEDDGDDMWESDDES